MDEGVFPRPQRSTHRHYYIFLVSNSLLTRYVSRTNARLGMALQKLRILSLPGTLSFRISFVLLGGPSTALKICLQLAVSLPMFSAVSLSQTGIAGIQRRGTLTAITLILLQEATSQLWRRKRSKRDKIRQQIICPRRLYNSWVCSLDKDKKPRFKRIGSLWR